MEQLNDPEELIITALDILCGYGRAAPDCACKELQSAHPKRRGYHFSPCPWAAVEKLGYALQLIWHEVEELKKND